MKEFHELLKGSKRILALCGAGLSAASGLDTFRGAGGMWRSELNIFFVFFLFYLGKRKGKW